MAVKRKPTAKITVNKIVAVKAKLTKPKIVAKAKKPAVFGKTQNQPHWRPLSLGERMEALRATLQETRAAESYYAKDQCNTSEPPNKSKSEVFWIILNKLNNLVGELSYTNAVGEDLIARIFDEPPSAGLTGSGESAPQPSGAVNLINQAFGQLASEVSRAGRIKDRLLDLA